MSRVQPTRLTCGKSTYKGKHKVKTFDTVHGVRSKTSKTHKQTNSAGIKLNRSPVAEDY
jgi:hypothetical protein